MPKDGPSLDGNNSPTTALHIAARVRNGDMVQFLLNRGADKYITSSDDAGETLFQTPARNGRLAAMRVLLSHGGGGVDINAKDSDGWTPA
jgi:ankyrin repeat protein